MKGKKVETEKEERKGEWEREEENEDKSFDIMKFLVRNVCMGDEE